MSTLRRPFLSYVVAPLVAGALLLVAYFSGVEELMALVAPRFDREYGLLEQLQLLVLLAAAWIAWRAARRFVGGEAVFWRAVALGALFVCLEEIDFGITWYEDLAGVPREERARVRNLHNQKSLSHYFKQVVDLGLAVYFVLLPLIAGRLPARARALAPPRLAAATVLLSVAVSKLAHYGEDHGWPNNGALRSNISEFRELFVYWLVLLYLLEMARRRGGEPHEGPAGSERPA